MHEEHTSETSVSDFSAVDATSFRSTLGKFASGIVVVTTISAEGRPYGVTATSFTSLSLSPPLVQWSLRNEAFSFQIFSNVANFAVNILSEGQQAISELFSRPNVDRFAGLDVERGLQDVPLITECVASIECELSAKHPAGDHTIIVGRVIRVRHSDRRPLLHWSGRYAPLAG